MVHCPRRSGSTSKGDVGVSSAFEVSPATSADVVHQLAGRGYEVDGRRSALVLPLDRSPPLVDPDPAFSIPAFSIHRANGDLLPLWQATSAQGWGHTTPSAIKASGAFERAATVVDGDGLVVARSADDGRPVGCQHDRHRWHRNTRRDVHTDE